jgi:hypothetical protein
VSEAVSELSTNGIFKFQRRQNLFLRLLLLLLLLPAPRVACAGVAGGIEEAKSIKLD